MNRFTHVSFPRSTALVKILESMFQGYDVILLAGNPSRLDQYLEWAELLGYTVKIKPKWVEFEKDKEGQSF